VTRLRDEVAVVTGGGQGIGAAIARMFAREGAAVLVADRDGALAARVSAEIQAAGGRAAATTTDISDSMQAQAMAQTAKNHFGSVTVLVNNAGINLFSDPLALDDAEWRKCLSVDLDGAWFCTRAILPDMLASGGGSIVNIASTHSFKIIRGCFPYPVAKHGLIGLTRALAVEYGPRGIRVNAVCPSYIDTQKNVDWFNTSADPAGARAAAENLHPLKRMGTAEEVAYAALYLASKEAGFVTGISLMLDGGRSVVYHD
jgi:NAD(P)-dependent dehydrogenase (short-subunit alcohol dehydrogenase family)